VEPSMPFDFQQLANFRLARGSHKQPNKGGNICVNEAAVIAAGFQYREIRDVSCLPDCFSRPVSEYAIYLNDFMTHRARNELLVPFITRLPGTSHAPWVEEERLVEIAGGIDIFADRGNQGAAKDRVVTAEEVVARKPDLIIGSWCGKKFRPERVATRAGFDRTPAVQNQDLYEIKSSLILQPGPAALTDGLAELQKIIGRWARPDD
jgi:hypothetical protein